MSPLHHHFELKGWAEITVVVRFWLIAGAVRRRRRRRVLPRMGQSLARDRARRASTSWHADWRGLRVAVLGLGVTGFAVADTLVELGADVLVVRRRPTTSVASCST